MKVWVKCLLPTGRYMKIGRTFTADWQCVDVTETELELLKTVPIALALSDKNPVNTPPEKAPTKEASQEAVDDKPKKKSFFKRKDSE